MKEKIKEFIIKHWKWIVLFICLIGFLELAEDVFNKEIMNGDIIGYKIISTFLISDFAFMRCCRGDFGDVTAAGAAALSAA